MIKPPIYPKTHRDFCKVCNRNLYVEPHEDPNRVRHRVLAEIAAHDSEYAERPCDAPPWHPRAHAFRSGSGLFTKLLKLQLGYVIEWDREFTPGITHVARALCLSDEDSEGEVWVEILNKTLFDGSPVKKLKIGEDLVGFAVSHAMDQHTAITRATRLNLEGWLPIDVVETVGTL